MHASFSQYYTAQAKVQRSVHQLVSPSTTRLLPVSPPPAPSPCTVQVAVKHHRRHQPALPTCQRHHQQTYSYDGGVAGPGHWARAPAQRSMTVQVISGRLQQATDKLQIHTYLLDEATSLLYQTNAGNNDYLYALCTTGYYPVTQSRQRHLWRRRLERSLLRQRRALHRLLRIGRMQISNVPPTQIPASGTYTAVVSWRTNFPGLLNLHMDVSDITAGVRVRWRRVRTGDGPGRSARSLCSCRSSCRAPAPRCR